MQTLHMDTYNGATRVLFIVGDPIAQVKSPAGLTRALRERGHDAVVVPAHVAPHALPGWLTTMATMQNVDGIVVTVPHKFAALDVCTTLTARARSIGAVNVLRRPATGSSAADGWHGDALDGEGHVAGLRKQGFDPGGQRALLVGAGGAGSAIAHALVDAGVAVLAVHDSDAARRDSLLEKLRSYKGNKGALANAEGYIDIQPGTDDPTGFDLVVNATPLGMRMDDPLPVRAENLQASTFVSDVITAPAVPPLMQAARAKGCATMTGSQMFTAVCEHMVDFYLAPT